MMYVLATAWGVLAGYVSGWIMYNACAGSKRDRLRAGIMWGIGIGIICALASIGG